MNLATEAFGLWSPPGILASPGPVLGTSNTYFQHPVDHSHLWFYCFSNPTNRLKKSMFAMPKPASLFANSIIFVSYAYYLSHRCLFPSLPYILSIIFRYKVLYLFSSSSVIHAIFLSLSIPCSDNLSSVTTVSLIHLVPSSNFLPDYYSDPTIP